MLLTLRYAFRSIRSAPLASGVVVLCIGLSIGATTTVFAWTEHLVHRPLPAVAAVERVVSVATRAQGSQQSVSYPDYLDWRDNAQSIPALAAFGFGQFALRASGGGSRGAEPVWGLLVTDNYFDVLGVSPALGRAFAPGESRVAKEAPLAVISHRLWVQRFGGEAAAIGRHIRLNGTDMTIIGVAPADFGGTFAGLAFDVWVPITMHPALTGEARALETRDARWLLTIGRLREGVTLAEAREELRMISSRFAALYPENAGREAYVQPLNIGPAQRLESLFSVLLGLTGLVTLIVCSNVANLLMLRGAARRYEIGVCLALGCGRGRIIGQLLCESMLLAGAGAILGVAVAWSGQQLLPALMPPSPLPIALQGSLNGRILAFGVCLAAAMVPFFGLLPAIHAFNGAVMPSLRLARGGAGRASVRLRSALVVAQLALSLTALISAGLFLRSLTFLGTIDRGFRTPEAVLLVSTDFDQAGDRSPEQRVVTVDRLLSGIRALPGVESATAATFVPLGFSGYRSANIHVPGYVPGDNESMSILTNRIAGGYFETMGIQVQPGRAIDERDTADTAPVVVVNQAFVQRFLSGREPIGLTIDAGSGPATVIGVAANGKYRFDRLEESSPPHVYLSYAQQSAASVTVHVRSSGRPGDLVPALRQVFASINPDLPLTSVTTLDEYTSLPMFPVRLGTTILSSLGLVALLLAATGLYGVMAYRVAQRWRELALRMALGASRSEVFALVFRDGARQTAFGILAGLVLSLGVLRVIAMRLPQLTVSDPSVVATSIAILVGIALAAALLPAVRAARVDPATVLRGE
jgi:putative ABC transport system permease protein